MHSICKFEATFAKPLKPAHEQSLSRISVVGLALPFYVYLNLINVLNVVMFCFFAIPGKLLGPTVTIAPWS